MQNIPEQKEFRVLDGVRSEEIVCLNREPAVCDRLGVMVIPVLRVTCKYNGTNINVDVKNILTAMACSTMFGIS